MNKVWGHQKKDLQMDLSDEKIPIMIYREFYLKEVAWDIMLLNVSNEEKISNMLTIIVLINL